MNCQIKKTAHARIYLLTKMRKINDSKDKTTRIDWTGNIHVYTPRPLHAWISNKNQPFWLVNAPRSNTLLIKRSTEIFDCNSLCERFFFAKLEKLVSLSTERCFFFVPFQLGERAAYCCVHSEMKTSAYKKLKVIKDRLRYIRLPFILVSCVFLQKKERLFVIRLYSCFIRFISCNIHAFI